MMFWVMASFASLNTAVRAYEVDSVGARDDQTGFQLMSHVEANSGR